MAEMGEYFAVVNGCPNVKIKFSSPTLPTGGDLYFDYLCICVVFLTTLLKLDSMFLGVECTYFYVQKLNSFLSFYGLC